MKNKNKATRRYVQRGCVTSSYAEAQDMLDYRFNGVGYIYWFVSYWAVYSV